MVRRRRETREITLASAELAKHPHASAELRAIAHTLADSAARPQVRYVFRTPSRGRGTDYAPRIAGNRVEGRTPADKARGSATLR
jgi:hypothetical protein